MLPTLVVRTVIAGAATLLLGHVAADWATQPNRQPAPARSSSIRAAATTPNGHRVKSENPLGANVELAVTAVGFGPGSLVSVRDGGGPVTQQLRADSAGTVRFQYRTPAAAGQHRLVMQADATAEASGSGNIEVSVAPFAILKFRD